MAKHLIFGLLIAISTHSWAGDEIEMACTIELNNITRNYFMQVNKQTGELRLKHETNRLTNTSGVKINNNFDERSSQFEVLFNDVIFMINTLINYELYDDAPNKVVLKAKASIIYPKVIGRGLIEVSHGIAEDYHNSAINLSIGGMERASCWCRIITLPPVKKIINT